LQIPRASLYRFHHPAIKPAQHSTQRPSPPLALSTGERKQVLDSLHEERFQDLAPHQVYAGLLDEGIYYCSIRTMYRTLESKRGEIKERRAQVQRPHYHKPELLAEAPNQVWSWDITQLKSFVKLHYGLAERIQANRANVLMAAFESNPKRFKNRIPLPPPIPDATWINKPKRIVEAPAERRWGVAETQSPENEVQVTARKSDRNAPNLSLKNELARCTLNN
jgi:hypothetical protein